MPAQEVNEVVEVLTFGEPMGLLAADEVKPLKDVEHFTRYVCGAEVNFSVGLARLGHTVAYVSKIGHDPFGDHIRDFLTENKIENRYVKYDDEYLTGMQLKAKVVDGDPLVVNFRKNTAFSHFGPDDLDDIDWTGVRHVHVTGIPAALSESCRAAAAKLMDLAREHGARVSFDPNLRPPLWKSLDDAKAEIEYGLGKCDILKISDNEVEFLFGTTDYDKGAALLKEKYNIPLILITLGKDGSRAYYKDMKVEAAPFFQENTIETTGAGDTFCASSLNYVLEHGLDNLTEENLKELLTFANAAASLIITRKGALRVMSTKEEVLDFMKSRGVN